MKLLISLSIILLFQQNLLLTFVNKCQFYKITSKRVYHCYHNLDLFRTLYVNFVSSTMSQRLQVRNTLFFVGEGVLYGFPGGSLIKTLSTNGGDMGSIPGLGRSPGEGMATSPVFLPGRSHGQGSLAGYSPWDRRVGHNLATKYKYKALCTSCLPLLPVRLKL